MIFRKSLQRYVGFAAVVVAFTSSALAYLGMMSRPDSSVVTESSASGFARLSDPDRIRALAR